ncbi:MAG TPA: site-specific integrase [Chryseosolibacter sp.]
MRRNMEKSSPKQFEGFVDFFRDVMMQRKLRKQNCFNYGIALKHLENFTGGEIQFNHLTKDWLAELTTYLKTTNGLRCEKTLSANSANTYFKVILVVAKEAADQRLIDHATISELAVMPRTKADLNYLNLNELNRLASTEIKHAVLKNAFLFSCLTGLGWREIDELKWHHIQSVDRIWHVIIKKDEGEICVPLNEQAVSLLGTFGKGDAKVFDLHYSAALCANLNKWAIRAGVYRQISFTTAKQTFGMTLLHQGVPIELISELLGHKHIKSTMKLLDYTPDTNRMSPQLLASF